MMVDSIKARKSSTTKRRRLKKATLVEEKENIEDVEISEGEDIYLYVDAVTKKKR